MYVARRKTFRSLSPRLDDRPWRSFFDGRSSLKFSPEGPSEERKRESERKRKAREGEMRTISSRDLWQSIYLSFLSVLKERSQRPIADLATAVWTDVTANTASQDIERERLGQEERKFASP